MATRKQLIQYAVGGIVVVAIAIGAHSYFGGSTPPPAAPNQAASKAPPPADDPVTLTPNQSDQILALVAQARQLAGDNKFDEANAKLDEADKVAKGQSQVAQARRDIAQMKTPEGQLNTQLTRAKLAVDHGDKEAAEKALAEVAKLKPDAPEIAELRAKLQQDEQKATHRDDRVTQHLTAMREAMAKQDFATANSELNAAERIAVDDPTVQQARRDLNRARNAAQKKDQ